jgi:multisubunit Na+/H+ antiporter MnhB subunit
MVGFGVSIFLITVGAIFKWAIKAKLNGVDLPALGVILMVVGAVSFVLSLIMTNRQPKRTSPELSSDERGGGTPPQM